MGSIKITLETLYDILRNEKKREDLQRLDEPFFVDVIAYLQEKKGLLEQRKNDTNIFAAGERDKLEYELRSIRRILKELYEKREKKILDIALNKSRTGSDIIDTSAMLREEKELYNQALHVMDSFRVGILYQLFDAKLPHLPRPEQEKKEELTVEQRKEKLRTELEAKGTLQGFVSSTAPATAPSATAASMVSAPPEASVLTSPTKIKFLHAVPRFIWKDLKEYGPFDTGDDTEIFPEVAELLVRKGRAVKV